MSSTPSNKTGSDATPGRPKESGSRQQTHPDQVSHSGSPSLDKESTKRGPDPRSLEKPTREN